MWPWVSGLSSPLCQIRNWTSSLLGPMQCDQVKPAAFKGPLYGSNSASLLPWTQMKNGMAENRETMPKPAPAQESGAMCT